MSTLFLKTSVEDATNDKEQKSKDDEEKALELDSWERHNQEGVPSIAQVWSTRSL